MKLSIRWGMTLGCILLVWMGQLFVAPFAAVSSRDAIQDHSRDIMENILALVLEETRNFLGVARGAVLLTERLISSDVLGMEQDDLIKLEKYFYEKLDIHSHFSGIYLGTPSGNFFYAYRERDTSKGTYRFRRIEHTPDGRQAGLLWRDKDKHILSRQEDPRDGFDPRERPWYIKAMKEKRIIWTEPYIFFTSGKPGITSAGPLYDKEGKFAGVVGVDIELDALSAFLGRLKVGKTGKAFIICNNREVIAFPDASRLSYGERDNNAKLRLPQLTELDDPLCHLAFEAAAGQTGFPEAPPVFASFKYANKTHFTMFTGVNSGRISWMIGVYLPEEDYMGNILATRRMTLLLTLAASGAATLLGFWAAGWVTRPISALDREARRIWDRDYSGRLRVKTCFTEIQRTADSFARMKEAVTDYKNEIREKDALHRAITDTANEAVIVADGPGQVFYWNAAAEKMFGFTTGEAVGNHIRNLSLFSSESSDASFTLHTLFSDKEFSKSLKVIETELRARNGKVLPAEVSLVGIAYKQQPYTIAVIRDITLRKRAETENLEVLRQLQEARKMEAIGTLAGGFAHDFNNILSGIMGYTELLRMIPQYNTASAGYIEKILAGCRRARDLLRRILTISFQDNRRLSLFELPPLIHKACDTHEATLPDAISIVRKINETCPPVFADALQVRQVVLHLMNNGLQAMEGTGGTLTIGLDFLVFNPAVRDFPEMTDLSPGQYICCTVTDTGIGIPPENMDKIFDPYFTTKSHGKGSGLGLSVIRGIVRNHGGGIYVDSRPGRGTLVRLFFPASGKKREQAPVSQHRVRIQKGHEHILLVERPKSATSIEQKSLEILGYRVTRRFSAEKALNAISEAPDRFDLVLLADVTMPGAPLAKHITAIRPDLPIVLLNGDSKRHEPDGTGRKGIRDTVTKPVRLWEMAAVMRRQLDAER